LLLKWVEDGNALQKQVKSSYLRSKAAVAFVAGLGGLVTVVNLGCTQPWAAGGYTPYGLQSIAASADGTKLVGVGGTYVGTQYSWASSVYASTDAGATWNVLTNAPTDLWVTVASSAEGSNLAAATGDAVGDGGFGQIYVSTNAGATWTRAVCPAHNWASLAFSADGTKLVAASRGSWSHGTNLVGGAIYISQDSGGTWARSSAPSLSWAAVASSAAGTILAAAASGGYRTNGTYVGGAIYTSLDSGATWTQASAPSNDWSSVGSSVDGTRLAAVASADASGIPGSGSIYLSTNSGQTWLQASAPSSDWASIALSAEGARLVAASSAMIDASGDVGATWVPIRAVAGSSAVILSADGYRVVAAEGGSVVTLPYFGPWRQASAPASWGTLAISADAGKLIVAGADHYTSSPLYLSTNLGSTWMLKDAPSNGWSSIALSADGTKMVAAAGGADDYPGDGRIYLSTDAGVTWTATSAPSNNWGSVASSADGSGLVAAFSGSGHIYSSTDSGATWRATGAPPNDWVSVVSSGDGIRLAALVGPAGDGSVYVSTNSGQSWTRTTAPTNLWTCIASSADGTRIVVAAQTGAIGSTYGTGQVYVSADSGATWTSTPAPSMDWGSVACSGDGTRLAALVNWSPAFYTSTDSGAHWALSELPAGLGHAVVCSADGSNILAAGYGAIGILRSPPPAPPVPPSPVMGIGRAGANLALSWLVPSVPFVLQSRNGLGLGAWTNLSEHMPPRLNFTNLHHELILPLDNGVCSEFYRLRGQ
jgi:hypothetical protein